jgi:uncharacterized integral membrane protein
VSEDLEREPVPGADPTRSAPGLGPHEADPATDAVREGPRAAAGPRATNAARVWIALAVATVLLILLIIFIAENSRSVTISFLGANGHISLALALLIAAVVGVAVTLLAGTARILQLRLEVRRHRRAAMTNPRPPQPR